MGGQPGSSMYYRVRSAPELRETEVKHPVVRCWPQSQGHFLQPGKQLHDTGPLLSHYFPAFPTASEEHFTGLNKT